MLDRVPLEILEEIVDYLKKDKSTLAKLARVSKRLYHVSVAHIYNKLLFSHDQNTDELAAVPLNSIKTVYRNPRLSKYVKIIQFICPGGDSDQDKELSTIIENIQFENLETVELYLESGLCDCFIKFVKNNQKFKHFKTETYLGADFENFYQQCDLPILTCIEFQDYSRSLKPPGLQHILESQLWLRNGDGGENDNNNNNNIEFHKFVYRAVVPVSKNLEGCMPLIEKLGPRDLDMSSREILNFEELFLSLASKTRIERLRIAHAKKLSPTLLQNAASYLKDLQFFNYDAARVGDVEFMGNIFRYVLPNCPCLEVLDLVMRLELFDMPKDLDEFLPKLECLTTLRIKFPVRPQQVKKLVDHMPNLRSLEFFTKLLKEPQESLALINLIISQKRLKYLQLHYRTLRSPAIDYIRGRFENTDLSHPDKVPSFFTVIDEWRATSTTS